MLLLPLQLGSAKGTGRTRMLHVRVAAYDIDVQITFGGAHPPASALVAAREELGRLVVPSCPTALELTAADAAAAKTYVPGWLPAHDAGAPGDSRSHGSRLDGLDARALKPGPGPVRGLAPLSL